MEVYSEWMRFKSFNEKEYDPKAFFDKILVYNQLRTTGIKNMVVKDLNIIGNYSFQNKTDLVEVTEVEDFIYRINKFATESTYQPGVKLDCMDVISTNVVNVPDQNSMPMRGKWFKVHLISEKPDYKVLLQLSATKNEEVKQ
jgi:hypothetical protein